MQIDWIAVELYCGWVALFFVLVFFVWKLRKKKVNPLKSNTELVTDEVVALLLNHRKDIITYRQVLNGVLGRILPGTSVHGKPYSKNPKSIYKGKVPYGVTSHGNLESER